jgi:hypothetical protein
MQKISEYRKHAEECRLRAARADCAERRDMLLTMAATWGALAEGRKRTLARQGHRESDGGGDAVPVGGLARGFSSVAGEATADSHARGKDENTA